MNPDLVCVFCGQRGHRSSSCPLRRKLGWGL